LGPLHGFKIIEIAGIGPTQLCGMILADMGAELIRIERPTDLDSGVSIPKRFNLMNRSRPPVAVSLKDPAGVELVLRLCESADALFEGFRPGVMERLGIGPVDCMARNKKLVFGRITGWGQAGPLASAAGHDANYIALSGALATIGERDGLPVLPLNLVADFGGGALYLATGILAAMLEASKSGEGQVVEAAMIDGVASMTTLFQGLVASGRWQEERSSNLLDGAAPFYRTYATKDGKSIVVGAIENQFFRTLLTLLEIDDIDPADQLDESMWAEHIQIFERRFLSETRDYWSNLLEGTDACFAPVLNMSEAYEHPHNKARDVFIEVDGITQAAPAPRFSRTVSEVRSPAGADAQSNYDILKSWGLSPTEVSEFEQAGVIGSADDAVPDR
jgi:alpha-methylacyl-CoA racemase